MTICGTQCLIRYKWIIIYGATFSLVFSNYLIVNFTSIMIFIITYYKTMSVYQRRTRIKKIT